MVDKTEAIRRHRVNVINSEVESQDKDTERKRLEERHGQVWSTDELTKDFTVEGFMAPFIIAIRKKDKAKGTMNFQHSPRFYWGFEER